MLFPPRGAKIRSEWQSVTLPAEPTLLSPRDDERIVLILYVGISTDGYPAIARTQRGITVDTGLVDYEGPLEIYGPEEIWVAQTQNDGAFHIAGWTYQVLYWA